MILARLLDGVTVTKMFRTTFGQSIQMQDLHIDQIQYDSRRVKTSDLFVALRGSGVDGHKFITDAVKNGAIAVVMENDDAVPDSYFQHTGVAKLVVPNSRQALAIMSANYFHHPSNRLTVIGVTGTNGKTTTTYLIKSILEYNGIKTGLIGTIEYHLGDSVLPASHTTPESLELNGFLARMANAGCSHVVMEVSSHALHQHRVGNIKFKAGIFTNLTQDHLDYHGDMDQYFLAKKILFENLSPDAWGIINIDDPMGGKLIEATHAGILTYGITSTASLYAKDVAISLNGTRFTLVYKQGSIDIESQLLGRFNVSNILAALGAGIVLGIPVHDIRDALYHTKAVNGRFEQLSSPAGWTAIIDYAHSPDALEKVLKAIHDLFESERHGRIITVFGCGGNRDKGKRPIMASIATSLSNITIITSDNPRHENPDAIIDEVKKGARAGSAVYREADRKSAIIKALTVAQSGDVVLIAGKGHEDYQITGDTKTHLSDRETVEEYLHGQL
jgi:UDP-N-acetylmuramoyl-L-alanyl-D-glutamate--2,6-diaminopimelate ligase